MTSHSVANSCDGVARFVALITAHHSSAFSSSKGSTHIVIDSRLQSYITSILETPTAPFREHWMIDVLDQHLSLIPGLQVAADRFGNRIVRLQRGKVHGATPIFVAHLDHPGFVFPMGSGARPDPNGLVLAHFEGRVDTRFFIDAPVRLYRSQDDVGIAGRIVKAWRETDQGEHDQIDRVLIEPEAPCDGARLAMWDLEPLVIADGMLQSRACDDLIGVACLLEMLTRLAAQHDPIDVAVIFSRAEEAGFCGVLCLTAEPRLPALLPETGIFVSVEISSEIPGVQAGEGAVIRTGDRSSTFDGPTADLMWSLARKQGIAARRALMNRGTCEATVFARAGYRSSGICIPLRNYHNQDFATGRIALEMVSTRDIVALADLSTALSRALAIGEAAEPPTWNNFDAYLRKGRAELQDVPAAPALAAQSS